MKLDPNTKVSSLMLAIPSSASALEKLGIQSDDDENKTLRQVCADRGIAFEAFLRHMDEIDWGSELPVRAARPER